MDKTVIIIVLVVVLAVAGFFLLSNDAIGPDITPTPLPAGIVLFFGDGCPHCKNVDDFVEANKIKEKVSFTKLEIPFGIKTSQQLKENAALMINLAQSCNIDTSSGVGVPFLYDPSTDSGQVGSCYIGDVDAINFFKNEAGIE